MVEAAIVEMRAAETGELDNATIAVINEAEEQADREEGVDLDVFRARMNRLM